MKKKVKDHRPGIRVPTAKGSIKFKSKKDYNRKIEKDGNEWRICSYCKEWKPHHRDGCCIDCNPY